MSEPYTDGLPAFDELPSTGMAAERHSWGVFGPDDVFGCLNLLTPERVVAAARLVRTGKVFSLNWRVELPDPPLFQRRRPVHRILASGDWQADELDNWNTQSSSQWDGFRHVRAPGLGYYSGLPDTSHGVHHWSRRGLAGRAVLLDLAAHRRLRGLPPLQMDAPDPVSAEELRDAMQSSAAPVQEGDVLLLHFGWVEWYLTLDSRQREDVALDLRSPGLQPGPDLLRLLWDSHISAVAADNPAVELFPPSETAGRSNRPASDAFAHFALLPLLGLPLGELFDLSTLAADCESDGVYEGLLTSAPLNLNAGVASPPNALFLK